MRKKKTKRRSDNHHSYIGIWPNWQTGSIHPKRNRRFYFFSNLLRPFISFLSLGCRWIMLNHSQMRKCFENKNISLSTILFKTPAKQKQNKFHFFLSIYWLSAWALAKIYMLHMLFYFTVVSIWFYTVPYKTINAHCSVFIVLSCLFYHFDRIAYA